MVALSALINIKLWQMNQYAQRVDTPLIQVRSAIVAGVCQSKTKNHSMIEWFFVLSVNLYYIDDPAMGAEKDSQCLQSFLWVAIRYNADKPTRM